MNKHVWSLVLIAAMVLSAPAAMAQSEGDSNPPEILTSELALKTVLETDRLEVNFVILDSDKITEVRIDGEKQAIEPGDTVLITRMFNFTKDVTRVQVSATDEQGHTRTVVYTVFRPGVNPAEVAAEQAAPAMRWFANYDVRYEIDDNPSNDLSSPISIEGVDLQGVVPDSEQTDSRYNVLASGGISQGIWNAFVGISQIEYSKSDNELFNTQVLFLGGGLNFALGDTNSGALQYTFADINLGGDDYAQTHTITPGYHTSETDETGDTVRTNYDLDITAKQFAASNLQDDTTVFALKRNYSALDKDKLDSYRSVYALGTASEGIKVSEFNYLSADWDWRNRWDTGLLFNIGVGVQYRDYANDTPLTTQTFLGDTRVDIPTRFSTGVGWQFRPELRVLASYRYLFNLSNKSPYVRSIYGIGVNGAF